jgi:hypothetical protein
MDRRYQIRKPKHRKHDRRASDVLRPLLKRFEAIDGEIAINAEGASLIKRELREAYRVTRELENEVSANRWNEVAAFDEQLNRHVEALHAPNVIRFPENKS